MNCPDAVVSFVKFIIFPHIFVPSFEFEPKVRIPLLAFLAISMSPFLDELFAICNTPVVNVNDSCYGNHAFDINTMDVWCLERLLMYIFCDNINLSEK